MTTTPASPSPDALLPWQEGIAGSCNIVTYNGEDICGIGLVADDWSRANIIRKHNESLRTHASAPTGQAGWQRDLRAIADDVDPSTDPLPSNHPLWDRHKQAARLREIAKALPESP